MSTAPKEKRRNSEKRKEKSRNAARCRREKETDLFYQLGHMLPLPHNICSTLDKAGIMRLVLCQLKIHKLLSAESNKEIKMEEDTEMSESDKKLVEKESILEPLYSKALEGFLLVLSKEGDIVFLSDNVSKYLGLTQIDLLGQSVYEYTHPCDHEEIREQLSDRPGLNYISSKPEREHHSFSMRMKCTLTPKGKNVNLKSATYKVVQCTGHIKLSQSETTPFGQLKPPVPCMVVVASPIPHPVNIETPLDTKTFMTRHSMDMKFTDCDERIQDLIGYAPDDLVGRSFYDFHHALDGSQIERCHRNLFAKGQTSTGHYRFLAKEGGYVWLETQATVIYHNKTNKAECVVCVNYVLSGLEHEDVPISLDQLRGSDCSGVQMSTEKIFAPKIGSTTSEYPLWVMNKKDQEPEADFLNFLAPTPGDTIVPLNLPIKKSPAETKKIEKKNPETCGPFSTFASVVKSKNKPLLSANQILFGQPGTVVDIPSKELELVDKNCPLNSSHDPLLTTESPDQQVDSSKQNFDALLTDDDLLSLYAPYMPMGEDLDLSADLENNVDGIENGTNWTPFSQNLEKEGYTPYNPVQQQENTMPFIPNKFSDQPRSPPSILSSPSATSHPNSPGSSFSGSMPNLCAFPGLPFSPVRSPQEPDGMDFTGSTTEGQKNQSLEVPRTSVENLSLQGDQLMLQTMSPSISHSLQQPIGQKPLHAIAMGQPSPTMSVSSLKRKLPVMSLDTGQLAGSLKHELRGIGEPQEKVYCQSRNDQPYISDRPRLPVTSGISYCHSSLLQQVARNHNDPYKLSRTTFGTSPTTSSGVYVSGSSKPFNPVFTSAMDRGSQSSQPLYPMEELCRILNLNT